MNNQDDKNNNKKLLAPKCMICHRTIYGHPIVIPKRLIGYPSQRSNTCHDYCLKNWLLLNSKIQIRYLKVDTSIKFN